MADPLKDMEIDIQSYDIDRTATVYFDRSGTRCWTKAWFNKREQGERAIDKSHATIKMIRNRA